MQASAEKAERERNKHSQVVTFREDAQGKAGTPAAALPTLLQVWDYKSFQTTMKNLYHYAMFDS